MAESPSGVGDVKSCRDRPAVVHDDILERVSVLVLNQSFVCAIFVYENLSCDTLVTAGAVQAVLYVPSLLCVMCWGEGVFWLP